MRIVALEEHVAFPEMLEKIPPGLRNVDNRSPAIDKVAHLLADTDNERLQSMDRNGISMQVLSVVMEGANLLSDDYGPDFARQYNDMLANRVAAHPTRFAAFAHLPTTNPEAAAGELERTVTKHNFCGALINGMTNDEFLDDPKYAPILARAETLGVPIYLHPGPPPKAVADKYYSGGLPKAAGMILSIAGWGWHSETAIHILRLVVSGTLDKYPNLKIIIGHMGEMLPMMMVRSDSIFKPGGPGANQRTLIETLRSQVHITTSGLFTQPPLRIALDTFGVNNIMFSVDYPFSPNEHGRKFLDEMRLTDDELEKIAFKNADRLLGVKAGVS